MILELERGINEELGDEGYYDVMDKLDVQESLTHPVYMYPVQRMYQWKTAGRTRRQVEEQGVSESFAVHFTIFRLWLYAGHELVSHGNQTLQWCLL